MGPSDAELLQSAAAGDRDGFAAIVERHRAAVWRLARGVCPTAELAEEAMQEAFVAAWRGAGSWSGRGSVRSWLLTLTRHAALRHIRRRSGEPARMEPLDELGVRAGWGREDSPETLAARLEERAVLVRALDRLGPLDREILIVRELEGLDGHDTATLLGLSLPAMKSRLHRARLRLLAELRKDRDDA